MMVPSGFCCSTLRPGCAISVPSKSGCGASHQSTSPVCREAAAVACIHQEPPLDAFEPSSLPTSEHPRGLVTRHIALKTCIGCVDTDIPFVAKEAIWSPSRSDP